MLLISSPISPIPLPLVKIFSSVIVINFCLVYSFEAFNNANGFESFRAIGAIKCLERSRGPFRAMSRLERLERIERLERLERLGI